MQRARRIVASARLFESLILFRALKTRSLHYQVTCYSSRSPLLLGCLTHNSHGCGYINTHQYFHFSSQANSMVQSVLANDSPEEIANALEKVDRNLTHESVIYVLKKLDKNPLKALEFFKWVSDKHESKVSNATYSLMLRMLGHKEWMKEFWVLISTMKDKGYEIDNETYLTLLASFGQQKMATDSASLTQLYRQIRKMTAVNAGISTAVQILLQSDWTEGVKKKLEDLKLTLSDSTIVKILMEIRQFPLRALSFFHWAAEHPEYQHTAVTYNAVLRVMGQEDSIEHFWSLIREMKSEGHDMDVDTYVKVLRHFEKKKMMKEAVELYEFMMDGPYKTTFHDCSFILRKISNTNNPDLDLVFRVVRCYEAAGNPPSKAVYDAIHRSLTRVGKFDESEKILRTMKGAGFEPDNITYSQLVFGLCKAGRLEEACKVLDDMELQGCLPDVMTWTILIQGHLAAGEVDKALLCFTTMMEKNCAADADLLEVLVYGLCNKNKVDAAFALVIEMVEKASLRPWQHTYKHLIEKLVGQGKLEEAFKLLRIMKSHNYPPFPDPFIRYISKFGTVEDATEFFKALAVRRFPSTSSYRNVFRSFLEEGRHSEAQDLLYKSPHHIRNHNDILNLFGSRKVGNAA